MLVPEGSALIVAHARLLRSRTPSGNERSASRCSSSASRSRVTTSTATGSRSSKPRASSTSRTTSRIDGGTRRGSTSRGAPPVGAGQRRASAAAAVPGPVGGGEVVSRTGGTGASSASRSQAPARSAKATTAASSRFTCARAPGSRRPRRPPRPTARTRARADEWTRAIPKPTRLKRCPRRGAARTPHRRRPATSGRFSQPFLQIVGEPRDRPPILSHRAPPPHGPPPVLERVEVDRDAEWSAHLILSPVAAPDRPGVVEVAHPEGLDQVEDLTSRGRQLLVPRKRQNGHLDRRQILVEREKRPLLQIPRRARSPLDAVSVHEKREQRPIDARRRLDHEREVPLLPFLVEIGQILPARLRVSAQVVVGAVRDPLELRPAERELVLDVGGRLRVVRQLVLLVRAHAELLLADPQVDVPLEPRVHPVLVPLLVGAGLDEVLHLHLLELARAEDEVPRSDLVAEGLADLGDTERQFLARSLLHRDEVDEHPLGGLRPEVGDVRFVLDRPHVGLEHEVESSRLGELAPALGAAPLPRLDRSLPPVPGRRRHPGKVVLPEATAALLALDQGVGERLDVAARLPDPRGHDDRGLEPDDVVAELDHRPPPGALHVASQLHAQRPVVPG